MSEEHKALAGLFTIDVVATLRNMSWDLRRIVPEISGTVEASVKAEVERLLSPGNFEKEFGRQIQNQIRERVNQWLGLLVNDVIREMRERMPHLENKIKQRIAEEYIKNTNY